MLTGTKSRDEAPGGLFAVSARLKAGEAFKRIAGGGIARTQQRPSDAREIQREKRKPQTRNVLPRMPRLVSQQSWDFPRFCKVRPEENDVAHRESPSDRQSGTVILCEDQALGAPLEIAPGHRSHDQPHWRCQIHGVKHRPQSVTSLHVFSIGIINRGSGVGLSPTTTSPTSTGPTSTGPTGTGRSRLGRCTYPLGCLV